MGINTNRREFLKTLSLAGASLALSGCSTLDPKLKATFQNKKPNILLILVDDLGYGDLSCYGAKDLQTPNIDRLVSQGMRLDNFYANSPVCSPTRAALLTGRYPDMVGVPGVVRTHMHNNLGYLSPHAVLLPKMLKKAGYHTALIGKWHLGLESPNKPNDRGFDHFHGFLGDMMDDYYNHLRYGNNYMRLNKSVIDPKGHATDLFSDWAADYIQNRSTSSQQPFFLYLAYNAPHVPLQPPPEWLDRVKKREKNITDKRAKLVAFIEHLDHGIAKVLDTLKSTGLSQNTLVIFTSDNGGQSNVAANNGPLNGGKGTMLEGGIKEPMCAVWPGKIKPNTRNQNLVALTMDIFPTLCEVAGVKIDHPIEAKSFLPTLLGKTQSSDDRLLIWVRREAGEYGCNAFYAVRRGNYKLLQNTPFEPLKLYDLQKDPREMNPLSKKHKMYIQLSKDLRHHIIRAGAVPWAKYPVKL